MSTGQPSPLPAGAWEPRIWYNRPNEIKRRGGAETPLGMVPQRRRLSDMRTVSIPLTQGKSTLIDEDDLGLVSQYRWHFSGAKYGSLGYAAGCMKIDGKSVVLSLHRFLLGAKPGQLVDHINGDGLDNRRCNLRICTHSENMRNRFRLPANNTSGYLGVSFERGWNRYEAHTKVNGKKVRIGRFKTAEEAARARDKYVRNLWGEFAGLNFPEEAS